MSQAVHTIYDTALELAVQSIGEEKLTEREFALKVYRRAVRFSALLGDPETVESLRYVAAAKVREVRLVGIDEESRSLLVCDPGDPCGEEAEKAEGGDPADEPEEGDEPVEVEVEDREDGDGDEDDKEAEKGEPGEGDELGAGDTAQMEQVCQRIPMAGDGIFAADVKDVAPALIGKACLVWIGTSKPYSLDNAFCDLGGMAIRIAEA